MTINTILSEIETALASAPVYTANPMPGDIWLVKSTMQKAIRRGAIEHALNAAASYWRTDRLGFWKRLGKVIALEDIGIGDTELTLQVLAATASAPWRKRIGEEQLALHLIHHLCTTTKNRMMDALYIQAERDPAYQQLRQYFADASDTTLLAYATDEEASLIERALACWYLAGTKKYPSDHLPPRIGNSQALANMLLSMPIPDNVTAACAAVIHRSPLPLAAFFPLIWQEAFPPTGSVGLFVEKDSLPPVTDVEGIPLYACDMFTRIGQASLRELQKAVPAFAGYSVKQMGLALFYLEGGRVDQRLTSESMEAFLQQGEITDIETSGLDMPRYLHLREYMREHLPQLNHIRFTRLQRMLEGAHA